MSNEILNSSDAQRICTLGGVEQKRLCGKLIELKDLEKTLDIAIKDVTQASKDEYFWRAMEVSAKLVQVTCDLTIAVLEEAAEKVGVQVGAKAISVTYDVAKMVVDAMNGDVTAKKALIYSANAKVDGVTAILSSRGSTYGKVLGHTKVLVNLANDLYEYWESRGKETITTTSSLVGARKTAYGQLIRIRQQIRETSDALSASGL
ncbi:hypothetical protein [Polaromonas glacialis]|uniref:hypothetical protein n=1 Tax=Polaromonas glacialis TaxID=866564 RepID=UPI000495342E|nr:hypothetical protein [Polaromonas glacialis]